MRYEAQETLGLGTWWVAEYRGHLRNVVATFWGDRHPDPEGAAKAEAERLTARLAEE